MLLSYLTGLVIGKRLAESDILDTGHLISVEKPFGFILSLIVAVMYIMLLLKLLKSFNKKPIGLGQVN